jgi:hypothetical protein
MSRSGTDGEIGGAMGQLAKLGHQAERWFDVLAETGEARLEALSKTARQSRLWANVVAWKEQAERTGNQVVHRLVHLPGAAAEATVAELASRLSRLTRLGGQQTMEESPEEDEDEPTGVGLPGAPE